MERSRDVNSFRVYGGGFSISFRGCGFPGSRLQGFDRLGVHAFRALGLGGYLNPKL